MRGGGIGGELRAEFADCLLRAGERLLRHGVEAQHLRGDARKAVRCGLRRTPLEEMERHARRQQAPRVARLRDRPRHLRLGPVRRRRRHERRQLRAALQQHEVERLRRKAPFRARRIRLRERDAPLQGRRQRRSKVRLSRGADNQDPWRVRHGGGEIRGQDLLAVGLPRREVGRADRSLEGDVVHRHMPPASDGLVRHAEKDIAANGIRHVPRDNAHRLGIGARGGGVDPSRRAVHERKGGRPPTADPKGNCRCGQPDKRTLDPPRLGVTGRVPRRLQGGEEETSPLRVGPVRVVFLRAVRHRLSERPFDDLPSLQVARLEIEHAGHRRHGNAAQQAHHPHLPFNISLHHVSNSYGRLDVLYKLPPVRTPGTGIFHAQRDSIMFPSAWTTRKIYKY